MGFALDMTFDLAMIMRISGTTNYKSIHVPVKMLSCSDARYNIDDIEMAVPKLRGRYYSRTLAMAQRGAGA